MGATVTRRIVSPQSHFARGSGPRGPPVARTAGARFRRGRAHRGPKTIPETPYFPASTVLSDAYGTIE
ncbi:hypothetical protein GCM10027570_41620 [Streptomonospora sediminis]